MYEISLFRYLSLSSHVIYRIGPFLKAIHYYIASLQSDGGARTRVTRIFRSGIQNRVRSNSALAETALGEESL